MKLHGLLPIAAVGLALSSAGSASAHFKLLKPASWIMENALGDPQKTSPCGTGASDTRTSKSNAVTTFRAGETITLEWQVTIPHPGWYRVALAENREELKDPDIARDANCNVDESKIPKGAYGNVLADGLFLNSNESSYKYQLTLPDEPCEKCTLQIIQFMEQHPPSCYYFHCADIKILPREGGANDGGSAPASDSGVADAGGSATRDAGASLDAGAPRPNDGAAAMRDAAASKDAAPGSTSKSDSGDHEDEPGDDADDESGCSLQGGRSSFEAALGASALALAVAWRRRKRRPR